jgi:Acyl-CoA dehydrogenase, C-terminal domain
MDFELSADQRRLLENLAVVLPGKGAVLDNSIHALDVGLWNRLHQGGFLDRMRAGGPSACLDSALIVEQVSRGAGIVPAGVHALVLPLFFSTVPDAVATIEYASRGAPYRFAAEAEILIRYEGDDAKAYEISPTDSRPVKSNYVYPLAISSPPRGGALGGAPAGAVRRRHRLAIAAEAIGAMDATLDKLVSYLSVREQFGRKLASLQAIHHRLSELSIQLESARWLSREAAWLDEDEPAALAAAFAAKAARRFCWEAHQLTGARGFTVDFGLYRHTLRLQLLSIECGSSEEHARTAGELRWGKMVNSVPSAGIHP